MIIAGDEFFEDFPPDCPRNCGDLEKALSALKDGGYVDIKYSRGDMYCVAPLKKYGEPERHGATEAKPAETGENRAVFAWAFAGGAVGALIISLIFALI